MSTPTDSVAPAPPTGTSNPWPLTQWWKRICDWIAALSPSGATEYDTGWVNVSHAVGITAESPVQVRRIGREIMWRGSVSRGAGWTPAYTTVVHAASIPVWARNTGNWTNTAAALSTSSAAASAIGVITSGEGLRVGCTTPGATVHLKSLSGYTVD